MKVLLVSMGEQFGGIEKLELDIMKNIDESINIDFLTPNSIPFKNYQNIIKKNHSNVYDFSLNRNTFINKIKYIIKLNKFLKKNKYDVVHINSSVFLFSFSVAFICKVRSIEKIIAHSHSVPKISYLRRLVMLLFSFLYVRLVDCFLSCSNEAKSSLLIKKYRDRAIVIKNGIDIDKYKYNEKLRSKYRKKYKLDGKVYGYVGRLEEEKNVLFLIDIFNEIVRRDNDSYLLIVGEGSLKDKLVEKISYFNLSDKVILLGEIDNVYDILNAMDIFILPSKREGFGISLIEAQANGLFVYGSSSIPNEVVASDNFKYFDLDCDVKKIVDDIINVKLITNRDKEFNKVKKSDYDILKTCRELENIYKS